MQSTTEVKTADAATKKNYKGGWLDKDLRRANGRVGLATAGKERPAPLNELWSVGPTARIVDGWVTAPGGSQFRVCPECEAWTGEARIAHVLEDKISYECRDYAKRGCKCSEAQEAAS